MDNGKGYPDPKFKKTSELFIYNNQCKYILLGGPTEKGYARLLGQYNGDEAVEGRITLIKEPPFADEMVQLASVFGKVSLRDVFRNMKFPPCAAVLLKSTSPEGSYAAVIDTASPAESKNEIVALVYIIRINNPASIPRNRYEQRADPSIDVADVAFVDKIREKKYCKASSQGLL